MFLSSVSGGLVALGLFATATHLGTAFYAFALLVLPLLAFVGLVTFERTLQSGLEDLGYARRIARLRAYYFDQAPELFPYLLSVPSTDRLFVQGLLGGRGQNWRTVAGMVGVITAADRLFRGATRRRDHRSLACCGSRVRRGGLRRGAVGADALPGRRLDPCQQNRAEHRRRDSEPEHPLRPAYGSLAVPRHRRRSRANRLATALRRRIPAPRSQDQRGRQPRNATLGVALSLLMRGARSRALVSPEPPARHLRHGRRNLAVATTTTQNQCGSGYPGQSGRQREQPHHPP